MDLFQLSWPSATPYFKKSFRGGFGNSLSPRQRYIPIGNASLAEKEIEKVETVQEPLSEEQEKEQLENPPPPQVVEEHQAEEEEAKKLPEPPKKKRRLLTSRQ